jgi:hypothetical protein
MEVFMAKSNAERGRFSSRKKMAVVLRVLRGDDLDLVSREAGITAATVPAWRDQFVVSGQAGLKNWAAEGRDDELTRLKALVGDLTMQLELSREAVQRLRGGAPLAPGKSTRRRKGDRQNKRGFPLMKVRLRPTDALGSAAGASDAVIRRGLVAPALRPCSLAHLRKSARSVREEDH